MIKLIISGKNKFKLGLIKKKKKNNFIINNINSISKMFKIKLFNKFQYLFKNKNFPINISNTENFNFKKI